VVLGIDALLDGDRDVAAPDRVHEVIETGDDCLCVGAGEAADRVGGSSASAGRSSSKKLSHGSRPPADGRNHQLRRSVALTRPLSVGVVSGGSRHGVSSAGAAVPSPSRLDSSAIACATRSSVTASPATTFPPWLGRRRSLTHDARA
jgi:hypothetical protein